MNLLRTSYLVVRLGVLKQARQSHLNGSNVGVLRGVLVLVKPVLGMFSFLEVDAKFEEQYHHRFQRLDRAVSRSLRGDMFVQNIEGSLGLAHCDELLRTLEHILRLRVRWRRHLGCADRRSRRSRPRVAVLVRWRW